MKLLTIGHEVLSSRAQGRMNISIAAVLCSRQATDQGDQQREGKSQSQREIDLTSPLGGSCRIK